MYSNDSTIIASYIKLTSRNELPLLLDYLGLAGIGVEIGVWKGEFSDIILEKSHLSQLYSIDSWTSFPKQDYLDCCNVTKEKHLENKLLTKQLLSKYGKRSKIIQSLSKDAVKQFKDHSLDFLYLDSNHKYEYVKEDLELWYQKVKIGGVISGHDYFEDGVYTAGTFGVKSAVDELVEKENQELSIIKEGYDSWYIIKREIK